MSHSLVSDLAHALEEGLGTSFAVKAAGAYVAVVHADFGLAAVVPSDSEEEASKAAAGMTAAAARAGVVWPAMHFAVSSVGVKPPWVVRAGASMTVDIVSAMARGSGSRPVLGEEGAAKVLAALASPSPAGLATAAHPPLSPHVLRLAEACVEKALGGQTVWVAGVEIDAKDVVGPNFMLPAVLIHAAMDWAIPVVASKGEGGFTVKLSPDPKAILGYRVSGMNLSSPVLLFLPIVNLVRRSFSNGECVLDDTVRKFAEFLTVNGLDTDVVGDVDVRVASTA